MVKGLIFDLDGTVIDSTKLDFMAFKKALKEFNIEFKYRDYIEMVGAKGEDIVAKNTRLPLHDRERVLNRKSENFKSLVRERNLQPVTGVKEFLLKIKEVPMWTALATGSAKDKLDFVMERVGLEPFFDILLTANDVNSGKPDPEVFLKAAKKLHLKPSECLVFEDAIMGIKAAKNAGMKCIALATSSPKDMLANADLIIEDFNDPLLEEFIGKVLEELV